MVKIKNIKDGNNILIFILLLLLFLSNFPWSIGGKLAEGIGVFAFLVLLSLALLGKLRKEIVIVFSLTLLFILIVFISNIVSSVQVSWFAKIIDIITFGKIFWIILVIWSLAKNDTFYEIRPFFRFFGKIFISLSFIFSLLTLMGFTQMSRQYNMGIPTYTFIFGFPVILGVFLFLLLPFVLKENVSIFRQLWFYLVAIQIVLTGKVQSIFFLVLLLIIIILGKRINSFNLRKLVILSSIAIVGTIPTIIYYFSSTQYSPRQLLMTNAFNVFTTNFPFGSGFATFGSPAAAQFYSPLYVTLGFPDYWGMGSGDLGFFLNDSVLSAMIAEFGFIGIIVFFILTVVTFLILVKKTRNDMFTAILLTAYISIFAVSLSSSYTTSALGATVMAVIGVVSVKRENDGTNT